MMLNVQDGDDDGDRGLLHAQDQQVPVRAEPWSFSTEDCQGTVVDRPHIYNFLFTKVNK